MLSVQYYKTPKLTIWLIIGHIIFVAWKVTFVPRSELGEVFNASLILISWQILIGF